MSGFPPFTIDTNKIKQLNTKTKHPITIASLTSHRVLRLDPFIESFNFKVSKKTEFEKFDAVNSEGGVIEGPSELSISITMNIPAQYSSQAKNNVMKIAELQTMIHPDIGEKNNTAVMLVHMKNLIARAPSNISSITFANCYKYGLPCIISSIEYTPEFDAGFFEEKYPKNIKLSLQLKIINQKLSLTQDGIKDEHDFRFAQSFLVNGMYQELDNKGFPFGYFQFNDDEVYAGAGNDLSQMGFYSGKDMSTLDHSSKTYIMFSNDIVDQELPEDYVDVNKDVLEQLKLIEEGLPDPKPQGFVGHKRFARRQAASENTKIARWVAFEPFIKDLNRSVEVEHKEKVIGDGAFSSGYESTVPKYIKYSLDFDVIAKDIKSAKINLAKLNTLLRLANAPTKEKFTPDALVVEPQRKSGYSKPMKVLIPGFLQVGDPGVKPASISLKKRKQLLPYCVDLHVYSIDFDIDDDIGFFETDDVLLPKAYNVKIELYSANTGISNVAYKDPSAQNVVNSAGPEPASVPPAEDDAEGSSSTPLPDGKTIPNAPTVQLHRLADPPGTTAVHIYSTSENGPGIIQAVVDPATGRYVYAQNLGPDNPINIAIIEAINYTPSDFVGPSPPSPTTLTPNEQTQTIVLESLGPKPPKLKDGDEPAPTNVVNNSGDEAPPGPVKDANTGGTEAHDPQYVQEGKSLYDNFDDEFLR